MDQLHVKSQDLELVLGSSLHGCSNRGEEWGWKCELEMNCGSPVFWVKQGQLTSLCRIIRLQGSSGPSIPFPPVSRLVPCTWLDLMSPLHLPSFVTVGPRPGSFTESWKATYSLGRRTGYDVSEGEKYKKGKVLFIELPRTLVGVRQQNQASSLPPSTHTFLFISPREKRTWEWTSPMNNEWIACMLRAFDYHWLQGSQKSGEGNWKIKNNLVTKI